ncbi:MAG: type II toxin-antitoxin system RelE/ParE family toxin [Rubrivivax sp.]|nr:MAG: type II toxin-antitoxin system RelE/ParE family toxin [Rubrivivax sp.]
MRARWTREARAQLKHQVHYLAERNRQAADRLYLDAHAAADLIARHPEFGRPIDPRVREWGIGREKRYLLRYVPKALVVDIVEFWHTAQERSLPA